MKKLITILAAVAMLATLCVPAFAADTEYYAGSSSKTHVSLKYQSDVNPKDEDPETPVDPDDPDYPDPSDPEPTDPDPTDPYPLLEGTYAICIPAKICMDTVSKTENGAVYLTGDGTIKCIQSDEGSGLDNNVKVELAVGSVTDYQILNDEENLGTYELTVAPMGSGITTTGNHDGHVANLTAQAFATNSTMNVNLTMTESNIYGNVAVEDFDQLIFSYGTNLPAEVLMCEYE